VKDSPYSPINVSLSPYLVFKSSDLQDQYLSGKFHPALYVKLGAAGLWHYKQTGAQAVITSLYRDDGIHSGFRAGDLRTRHIYPYVSGRWEAWLNLVFLYYGKAGCKTAMIHEVKKCLNCGNHCEWNVAICNKCGKVAFGEPMGIHLHLQVGPREPAPEMPDRFIV